MALRCAREGDQQAWTMLFEMHFDAVFSYCTQLAQGHATTAEDVTQETFMIAARRISRFQTGRGSFRSWLMGIARNRHLKLVTSGTRRRQREDRYATDKPFGMTLQSVLVRPWHAIMVGGFGGVDCLRVS